ncbi:MAG: glycosyltransferase family 2 protein [Verrucomicrobiota bacterium]
MSAANFQSPFPKSSGLRPRSGSDNDSPDTVTPRVSVIVPFYNEEECVESVLAEIIECQPHAEIIAIDDGSSDSTWDKILSFKKSANHFSPIRLTQNRGQSAAVYAGLRAAVGDITVLMDGDGQNDPADIDQLVAELSSSDADVVCGRRAKRQDTWSRRTASKIANSIRRMVVHDGISDTGCSLKAFPKDCVELLVPFNGMHRFLPAVFTHAGLKLIEVDVNHRARTAGDSKYTNWDRALRGIYDLFGIRWLLNRKIIFPELTQNSDQSPSRIGDHK